MTTAQKIIKALLRTEKSTTYEPSGKYLFLVHINANKIQIKAAVQELYKVKVKAVNTFVSMGKLKKVRYQLGDENLGFVMLSEAKHPCSGVKRNDKDPSVRSAGNHPMEVISAPPV